MSSLSETKENKASFVLYSVLLSQAHVGPVGSYSVLPAIETMYLSALKREFLRVFVVRARQFIGSDWIFVLNWGRLRVAREFVM